MVYKAVIKDKVSIGRYSKVFSRFPSWKATERDIKISNVLNENKRLLLNISDIKTSGFVLFCELGLSNGFDVSLNNVSFCIENISIILDSDLFVDEMELNIRILNTTSGKQLESLLDSGIVLNLHQHFYPNGDFCKFYLDFNQSKNPIEINQ